MKKKRQLTMKLKGEKDIPKGTTCAVEKIEATCPECKVTSTFEEIGTYKNFFLFECPICNYEG